MKYTVQIYISMISKWETIAKLKFCPDEYTLSKIADDTS